MRIPNLSDPFKTRGVTALLGPTNTGKTHYAIQRMLGHKSGVIGLPLRLLAREVYQRISAQAGAEAVALITGEEKIRPSNPRYWVSTVEAMPRDVAAAFVAVDEIQLAADADRGHVFTDALLNRRGTDETILIGSETMRPLIGELIPTATIITRPRLSKLSFAGERKLTRLPPRSAIVAFSADEVYAIAELLRRERGGAAVVLGALSPRTRNAQVALFQSGEVDLIVATDAIGMGLNLEVDHVAFAADRKFDGFNNRRLTPAEMGQIAGRAGRHLRDGTFGTTGRCPALDEETVQALEDHRFDPVRLINWRNPDVDFASIEALQASLAVVPTVPGLVRARAAEDETTFDILSHRPVIRELARGTKAVERLWDVCKLPDYRKVVPHTHADLVQSIYEPLMRRGAIPSAWFSAEVSACDRIDGDISTLSARIAHIRTWTYCANRSDWLEHPQHWQNVTRAIEDKLSDALHEKLAQRFIDRRTSVLMRRLRENAMLEAEITDSGDVLVESQHLGRLEGFRFTPDASAEGPEAKALKAVAARALAGEIDRRARRLAESADNAFALSLDGTLRWIGAPVAKLQSGDKLYEPRVLLLADDHLSGPARQNVEERLGLWLKAHVAKYLGPLTTLEAGGTLTGAARGIGYRIAENYGVLDRSVVADVVRTLDQQQRSELRSLGIRFGAHHLYAAGLMKPAARALAAQLFALRHEPDASGVADVSHLAASGRTSIPIDKAISKDLYRVGGYKVAGERAIRVDILERLADLIRPALAWRPTNPGEVPAGAYPGGGFVATGAMTSLVGASGDDFAAILTALGYRKEMKPHAVAVATPVAPSPAAAPPAPEAAEAEPEAAAEAETGQETVQTVPEQTDPAQAETGQTETEPAAAAAEVAASPADTVEVDAAEATPATDAAEPEPQTAEPQPAATDTETAEPAAHSADHAGDAGAAPETAAEPVMVAVWRPGRPDHARRPHGRPNRGQHARGDRPQGERTQGDRPQGDRPPGDRPQGDRPQGDRPYRDRPPRRDDRPRPDGNRPRHDGPRQDGPRQDGPRQDGPRPEGQQPDGQRQDHRRDGGRPDRPEGDRKPYGGNKAGGKGFGGGRRPDKRPERPQGERSWQSAPQPTKGPDPDSPFAKLAALKAQLDKK